MDMGLAHLCYDVLNVEKVNVERSTLSVTWWDSPCIFAIAFLQQMETVRHSLHAGILKMWNRAMKT